MNKRVSALHHTLRIQWMISLIALAGVISATQANVPAPSSTAQLPPDITVAKDGSGKYKTVGEALASLEITGRNRVVIFIRNGVYTEQLAINRPNVTLRGESREGTRIEYSLPRAERPGDPPLMPFGRGVVNVFADDVILENLTVANTYPHRRHTFTLYGRGTRTLTQDCNFLAEGNDTVSLWAEGGGLYYHARCHMRGNIDFLCPRGWCFVRDSSFYEVDIRAALWHDGGKDPRKKPVIVNSSFDGAKEFPLGRYPRDFQFYLIGCRFSEKVQDVRRDNAPSEPNEHFRWGHRVFFHDSHRDGGDAPWDADNLHQAAGSPRPQDITPAWTFGGHWDPERTDAPRITAVRIGSPERVVEVRFSEPISVRGNPTLVTRRGKRLWWTGVNGTNTLTFALLEPDDVPVSLDTGDGLIFASLATTQTRAANLKLP